jgi:hypothetical protein
MKIEPRSWRVVGSLPSASSVASPFRSLFVPEIGPLEAVGFLVVIFWKVPYFE